jgi:hypothetical protein
MTLFGLEILAGFLIGGLTTTKTVTEIKKNLRDSDGRNHNDNVSLPSE